jgi:hypothetical protein
MGSAVFRACVALKSQDLDDLADRGSRMKNPHLFAAHDDDSQASPQLPFFRTWRGVYIFVLACFVAAVVVLTVFTRVFAT